MLRARTPFWPFVVLMSIGAFAHAVGSPSLPMTQIVFGLAGVAAVLYFSVPQAVLAMLGCQVVWILVMAWSSPQQVLEFIDIGVQATTFTVAGAAVLAVIENRLRVLDDMQDKALSVRLAGYLESERKRVLNIAKRLVHDEFIGALRVLADGGPISDGAARAAAEAATLRVRQAGDFSRPQTIVDWVHQIVQASPAAANVVEPDDSRWLYPLSEDEAEAITTALGEALRNVSRHAEGSSAVVQIVSREDEYELRVMDQGPGVAAEVVPGWGISHSIRHPITAIGGTFQVVDSPGGGVTVVLRWPVSGRARSALLDSQQVTAEAAGSSQSLPWVMSLPALAGNAYIGVRYSWGDQQVVAELINGLVVLLVTLVVVHLLARHVLSGQALATYALFTGLATHVGIELAGPDAVQGYDSWIVALANVGLVVVAFYCPRRHALATLMPSLIVVTVHVAIATNPWAGMGALLAVAGLPVLAAHFGAALRDVSREVDAEERVIAQLYHDAQRVRIHDRVEEPLIKFLRTDVLPWLDRLDWDAISVTDRQQASILSAALRDQLYLPGVLDPALRQRIWHSRAAGRQVVLQAPEGGVEGTTVLLRLLDRILDLTDWQRVSMRFPGDRHEDAEVLVVPTLNDADVRYVLRPIERLDWEVVKDVVSTRITIRPQRILASPGSRR